MRVSPARSFSRFEVNHLYQRLRTAELRNLTLSSVLLSSCSLPMCCKADSTYATFRLYSGWQLSALGTEWRGAIFALFCGLSLFLSICAAFPIREPEVVLILLAVSLVFKQRAASRESTTNISSCNFEMVHMRRTRPSADSPLLQRPRFLPSKELGGTLEAIPEEEPWPSRVTCLHPITDVALPLVSLDAGSELELDEFDDLFAGDDDSPRVLSSGAWTLSRFF